MYYALLIAALAATITGTSAKSVEAEISGRWNEDKRVWDVVQQLVQLLYGSDIEYEYGVVVDIGSSGSKVRVYNWPLRASKGEIPDAQQQYSRKTKPGLSSFAGSPDDVGPYVEGLLAEAKEQVPEEKWDNTAIYFMATAGMRLLAEDDANALMTAVDTVLSTDANPFYYESQYTRILSGEEEGAFAWVALNYLTGYLTGDSMFSDGVLEMGGASAQIGFEPEGSILANKFPVTIDDGEYPLYVHSYLKYGATESQNAVVNYLLQQHEAMRLIQTAAMFGAQSDEDNTLQHPCMLRGDSNTVGDVTLVGSGDPTKCAELVKKLLIYTVNDSRCSPAPCAIGPFYQPSVPEDMVFYAVAAFLYPAEALDLYNPDVMDEDRTLNLTQLHTTVTEYCQDDYSTVANLLASVGSEEFTSAYCFLGLYMYEMFTAGYGFAEDTTRIKVSGKVDGTPISWPLGALIYETQNCPLEGRG